MAEIPRLNNMIRALEEGRVPVATFSPPTVDSAVAFSTAAYDAVIFESEHNPFDMYVLRDCLQYMLNRRQIVEGGTIVPAVTPMVRVPVNGADMSQWIAKQVLDIGAYGIVFPRVSTVEQAYNAVSACRYPRPKGAPNDEPEGQRGDNPVHAARYWGITQQEYYQKADVWPLNPQGEVLVIIQCEQVQGIDNLPRILEEVKGIGGVLIGEGDLSQNLGVPRQYDHPVVVEAMTAIRRICAEHNVACGHPHVSARNAEKVLGEGYRFVLAAPERTFAGLEACRKLAVTE
ncbi:MAG: aldolase [Acidobacteria bacterium]|nr:aldolase [Acidobacteriota bacterium]